MPKSTWGAASDAVILPIIKDYTGDDIKELAKLISVAYPFGERKNHPYKMYLKRAGHHLYEWNYLRELKARCS